MIAYVESNFVLELALLQAEHQDCLEIVGLAEKGSLQLLVPAISLAEPYATLTRRRNDRRELRTKLSHEFAQLARSELYERHSSAMSDVISLLVRSEQEEERGLDSTVAQLRSAADVIPLTSDVLASAVALRTEHELSAPDAIVYASVRSHLDLSRAGKSCFLNKNAKDFDLPDIHAALAQRGCKLLFSFRDGLGYMKSRMEDP